SQISKWLSWKPRLIGNVGETALTELTKIPSVNFVRSISPAIPIKQASQPELQPHVSDERGPATEPPRQCAVPETYEALPDKSWSTKLVHNSGPSRPCSLATLVREPRPHGDALMPDAEPNPVARYEQ